MCAALVFLAASNVYGEGSPCADDAVWLPLVDSLAHKMFSNRHHIFQGCVGIKTVHLPASLAGLGVGVFQGCTGTPTPCRPCADPLLALCFKAAQARPPCAEFLLALCFKAAQARPPCADPVLALCFKAAQARSPCADPVLTLCPPYADLAFPVPMFKIPATFFFHEVVSIPKCALHT